MILFREFLASENDLINHVLWAQKLHYMSNMAHWASFADLKIFLRIGVSQGFRNDASIDSIIKLNSNFRQTYGQLENISRLYKPAVFYAIG